MKKKICSWWCSAPRPNPSLLALAKPVLSEPYGLWFMLKPSLTKHKSFAREDLDEKSSSTGGHDECYLPGKHCIWKVRGGKQKLRACFPTWKVWVSPKFGVKQYTFNQLKTFRLKCLSWEENIYAYVYVDILVRYVDIQSSIDTYVHRWHLLLLERSIFTFGAADPAKSPRRHPELLQATSPSKHQLCCLLIPPNEIRTD